jgi:hypothetical protein
MGGPGQLGPGNLERIDMTVERDGWTLVRSESKAPVSPGEALHSFRGRSDRYTLAGGHPPKHAASTGRVYVVEGTDLANGSHYCREFFPSVFGLEWVRGA